MAEKTVPELQAAQKAILDATGVAWAQTAPAPGDCVSWLPLLPTAAADVPNSALYLDSASGKVCFKDSAGDVTPLY